MPHPRDNTPSTPDRISAASIAKASTAAEAWDAHAEEYRRSFSPLTGFFAQCLFQLAAGRLPAPARILDIACGSGELARAALMHRPPQSTGRAGNHVVATDLSPQMVALAQSALAPYDTEDRLRCEVHDGEALGFDDDRFDGVFSSFGIFLFPNRAVGWQEAARVLRKGGLFGTTVWRHPEENQLARVQMEFLLEAIPERVRADLPEPAWLAISSPAGLAAEIGAAGFRDAEVAILDAMLIVPTPAQMWHAMQDNPIVRGLLVRCSDDELTGVKQHTLRRFEERAGGSDRPLYLPASCHALIARKA